MLTFRRLSILPVPDSRLPSPASPRTRLRANPGQCGIGRIHGKKEKGGRKEKEKRWKGHTAMRSISEHYSICQALMCQLNQSVDIILSICHNICLCLSLSQFLSVSVSLCLSQFLCVCLSFSVSRSVCFSVGLSVSLSVCLSLPRGVGQLKHQGRPLQF